MTVKFKVLIFLLLGTFLYAHSQTVKAYIYDDNSVVKGCYILNSNQNIVRYSDDNGYFEIPAMVGDSLIISSVFHSKLDVIINASHFKEDNVFVINAVVNELDEVLITDTPEKEYNNVEFSASLKSMIAEDIKNNPHLYGINASQYGVDFVYLYKLVAGLFKKKKVAIEQQLDYSNLRDLFNSSRFFTEDLIVNNMGISKENKFLFLEYCSLHRIDSSLARKERELELLDTLMIRSIEFKRILKESTKKD